MKKKKILIFIVLLCLLGVYSVRIYKINSDKKLPECQVFEKGELVPYGKDYNISENDICEGYYVKVLSTQIMETEEFCEKYDTTDMGLATHYYMVDIEVQNNGNEQVGEQGVALGMAMLIGTNYAIVPSPAMFKVVNPDMPGSSFSLQNGTKKEVCLVFAVIPNNMPDYEYIKKDAPMLQITQYPTQKLIKL